MKKIRQKVFDSILNVVYPQKCMFCKNNIAENSQDHACGDCIAALPYTKNGGCFETFDKETYLISPLLYEGNVRRAVRDLKFKSKFENAQFLAMLMCGYLSENKQALGADVIVSVPLSKKSLLRRGFNQTELIASKIAAALGIRFDSDALIKVRETKRQSSLTTFAERAKNVLGAYRCVRDLSEKTVILVDDVYTSGMTIYNCARELKQCGAKKVIAITCANAHVQKGYSVHDYKASRLVFKG
ncbi:MAG: ComF family protein [Ruminococcaceae bacterium]|nr:ComF family protein [Oscillospiraceae bacterium]